MDPIADFLTQIRNAYMARLPQIKAPHSNIKEELAGILSKAGFLSEVSVEGEVPTKFIVAKLSYDQTLPALTHISRVSKPSVRTYTKASTIKSTLNGRGMTILTTSKGLMTDRQARKQGIGGEIICRVW